MMEVGQDSRLPGDLSLSNQRSALEGCCSKGAGTVVWRIVQAVA